MTRFQFVADHQQRYGVKRLCQIVKVARLRARVAELEASERKLNSERDILRAAAKYFAGETRW